MKKLLFVLVASAALMAAVALVNTARFASKQPPAEPAVSIVIDTDTVAAHLAGAIRFPTVSFEDAGTVDHTAFAALHDYLERSYPDVHRVLTREVINRSSLLYTWRGSEKTLDPVVLMGHLDVVPVVSGTEAQLTHPPFAGAIGDGYVWGRGAVDNKSSVIAVLEAVEKLASEGYQPRRTVYLAFGHDEEVGGPEGAARVADALASRGVTHFAFVTDEGGAVGQGLVPGIDKPTALIGISEKGYLNLRLTVEGEGGHSSTPPSDTNVGILSRTVAMLEATAFPARLDGTARAMTATSTSWQSTQVESARSAWSIGSPPTCADW